MYGAARRNRLRECFLKDGGEGGIIMDSVKLEEMADFFYEVGLNPGDHLVSIEMVQALKGLYLCLIVKGLSEDEKQMLEALRGAIFTGRDFFEGREEE